MAIVDEYLSYIVQHNASDLHLSSNHPPYWRVHGVIQPLDVPDILTSEQILKMLREVVPPDNFAELQEKCDTDCAYALPGVGRFRVNGFRDINGYGAVFRHIPEKMPAFDDLGLPEAVREFCRMSKGLVVVTGPTGSGKSTTLAAMIDYINSTRTEHIITIEDPVEFVHHSRKCLINQREVHRDTESFSKALRAALREDPDIVLIGEIRDLETMEIAIETAETGHLVFATLHTNTAISTVDRIIDRFPEGQQNQIRSMLADTLKGVVAQILCPKVGGGRVAAFEVLVVNVPVAAMIREAKTHMLQSVMQTSRNLGMQTFNDELCTLIMKGQITPEEGYIRSIDKIEMEGKMLSLGVSTDFKKAASEEALRTKIETAAEQLNILRTKLQENSDDLETMVTLAWFLAVSPYDELRNGREALKLAERANSIARKRDPHIWAVLGAAQAECRDFRRAVASTQTALKMFLEANDEVQRVALDIRINRFQKGEPHRED